MFILLYIDLLFFFLLLPRLVMNMSEIQADIHRAYAINFILNFN